MSPAPTPLPENSAFVIVGNPPELSGSEQSPSTMAIYMISVTDKDSMDLEVETFVNTLTFPFGTSVFAVYVDDVHRYQIDLKLILAAPEPPAAPPGSPAPVTSRRIASLDPTSGPLEGGTELTLTGEGFTNIGGVRFESAAQTGWASSFAVNTDTQMICTTPQWDKPEQVNVIVFNGDPGDAQLDSAFTYEDVTP